VQANYSTAKTPHKEGFSNMIFCNGVNIRIKAKGIKDEARREA
jgi:hypothetical protein